MFDRETITNDRDPLRAQFQGMKGKLCASPQLRAALITGTPLHTPAVGKRVHVRRFTKAIAVYAVCALMLVGVALFIPHLFNDNKPATTTEVTTTVPQDLPYEIVDGKVVPISPTGQKIGHRGSMGKNCNTLYAYQFCDAVARVRIGNWLNEDGFSTRFEAEVLEIYKGVLPAQFVIQQDGNSKSTIGGYPLFYYGEEYLVFLKLVKPEDVENFEVPPEKQDEYYVIDEYPGITYWIVGSFATVFDYATDENGNIYIADRENYVSQCGLELTDYMEDEILAPVLKDQLPSVMGAGYKSKLKHLFLLDEVIAQLEEKSTRATE